MSPRSASQIDKGTRVESVGPTVWPHGKIQQGVTLAVIDNNRTPFGGPDADTYWVKWDNGQIGGPYWMSDLIILDGGAK